MKRVVTRTRVITTLALIWALIIVMLTACTSSSPALADKSVCAEVTTNGGTDATIQGDSDATPALTKLVNNFNAAANALATADNSVTNAGEDYNAISNALKTYNALTAWCSAHGYGSLDISREGNPHMRLRTRKTLGILAFIGGIALPIMVGSIRYQPAGSCGVQNLSTPYDQVTVGTPCPYTGVGGWWIVSVILVLIGLALLAPWWLHWLAGKPAPADPPEDES
jgi:hypothetical protein